MIPAEPAAQARVLRRLFLTLMLRGRRSGRSGPSRVAPAVGMALSLGLLGLFGLVAFSFSRGDLFVFAGCLHALAFLMVGTNLAVTSSQLLFNPEEAEVLLHRPIAPRALLSAKLQTVTLVSFALAVAVNLCGLVLGVRGTRAGWMFLPAHLVSLGVEILFVAGFIVLAYNLCLHWFGRERLENLMTGVQMVVAVALMLAGQLVPRLLMRMDLAHVQLPAWLSVFPPVWFAALDVLLTGGPVTRRLLLSAGVGVAATAVTVWLGAVRLATAYEQGLETLNETGPAVPRTGGRRVARARRWPGLRWWLRDPVEAAGFSLTLVHLGRARGVKLRVYPMLAQFLIYPVIILFGGMNRGSGIYLQPYAVAYAGCFFAMLPTLVLDRLRLSEDFEAAEIFRQAPLARPSALFHGARKAIITALCLPGLVLVVGAGALWLGDRTQLLLLLPGLIALPPFSLLASATGLFVPFAEPVEGNGRGFRTTVLIFLFQIGSFVLAGIAGWTFGAGYFAWLLLAEGTGALVLTLGLQATIRQQGFPEDD